MCLTLIGACGLVWVMHLPCANLCRVGLHLPCVFGRHTNHLVLLGLHVGAVCMHTAEDQMSPLPYVSTQYFLFVFI
jgi:hypothetical protein